MNQKLSQIIRLKSTLVSQFVSQNSSMKKSRYIRKKNKTKVTLFNILAYKHNKHSPLKKCEKKITFSKLKKWKT